MSGTDTILKFRNVSFAYAHNRPVLIGANAAVRRGSKVTLMGQNGAGKSTLFSLITRTYQPDEGEIHLGYGVTIAHARQVIPREELTLTVRAFFERCFSRKVYDIDPRIDAILEVVQLHAPHDKIVGTFSGGQQARLLLASALIQVPDLLLLDEPTNNLDAAGIAHLTDFLKSYKKTVIVISHDADFLNAFTQGVLYLDVHTHQIEQYDGNYTDVVQEIAARVKKEQQKNAQYAKEIQANKDKANYFAHKGGQMRLVAKRMREKVEAYEASTVEVRKEDKTIRPFSIPIPPEVPNEVVRISSYTAIIDHTPKVKKTNLILRRGTHVQLIGPNGIGKSTLLETLASGHARGEHVSPAVRIGYYRQDFSNLNFSDTVYETLCGVMERPDEQLMRSVAAGFLITGEDMHTTVGHLSEGQKGLVAFAQLVLMKPGLLILDEPTNHINFRHIPVIAAALSAYKGALIVVSHMPEFIQKIHIDGTLDLSTGKLVGL